ELYLPHKNDFTPGRVITEHRGSFVVRTHRSELQGIPAGKFYSGIAGHIDFPSTGDWVLLQELQGEDRAVIHHVLPRKTALIRKSAGKKTEAQIIGANLDIIFIVQGLDGNFNLNRMERYITLAETSGARPVVLLNKSDLCENLEETTARAAEAAGNVPLHTVSARYGGGVDIVLSYISEGVTAGFVGSSGVGKSTLINALLGSDVQQVIPVRDGDSRGRHTTTSRHLFLMPSGGLLMDTPGMRELSLWDGGESGSSFFDDIESLGEECRFRNCTHSGEPGCRVLAAVEEGVLDPRRLENYRKLQKEQRYMESLIDEREYLNRKREEKKLHREIRRFTKNHRD
ncbi:MAG TPA: ribosome small subunit-dependent GTPase A, partial [Spirochaetota bacterium]|nr:ribosome small subunit-dependent GTPase A [Spirochaetota bacterium]